jgi:predicted nucleic acid-binding protein
MPGRQYLRPYLDTSVYLAAINGEPGRLSIVRDILDAADRGIVRIVASTFVAAEVIRPKGEREQVPAEKELVINEVLDGRRIDWVELDLPLAVESRRLARLHNLKPADAVHLASAVRAQADILLRWNHRFRVDDGITEIEVCDPYWWGEAALPFGAP